MRTYRFKLEWNLLFVVLFTVTSNSQNIVTDSTRNRVFRQSLVEEYRYRTHSEDSGESEQKIIFLLDSNIARVEIPTLAGVNFQKISLTELNEMAKLGLDVRYIRLMSLDVSD